MKIEHFCYRKKGDEYAKKKTEEFKKKANNVENEITVKTRLDAAGIDKASGKHMLQEYKSSSTTPLTKNQAKTFPEIEESGATVVGKRKGIFTGGTKISPTKVDIIRPNE